MRLCLQRVLTAHVDVDGARMAAIGRGLLVLAGFGRDDPPDAWTCPWWRVLVAKVAELRIFPDAQDKMNLGVAEAGGEVLVVSQFTLYADCRRGRRPSFTAAAPPETAEVLFDRLAGDLAARLPGRVGRGVFGARMEVGLVNWGPVTILLDSRDFA